MGSDIKKALIWDLDGTLMDSYEVITTDLVRSFARFGVTLDYEEVHDLAIRDSVTAAFRYGLKGTDLSGDEVRKVYLDGELELEHLLKPMPHAVEIVDRTNSAGLLNFIYTHRGTTTDSSLRQIGLDGRFVETVTSQNGFARKPDPEGIDYLVEKYGLDRKHTYYVGDRRLDVECANNAGVNSIFFLDPRSILEPVGDEDYVVGDLIDILEIVGVSKND